MATFEAQQVAKLTIVQKCLKRSGMAHLAVLLDPQQHERMYRVLSRLSAVRQSERWRHWIWCLLAELP
jgi:hypothetical protein